MKINKIFEPKIEGNFFFGYYDKPQISSCNNYYLSHKINFLNRYPNHTDEIDLGYFNIHQDKFFKIDSTSACNFQQGSMLNWLDGSETIIFNKLIDQNYYAVIKNIHNKKSEVLKCPIYSLSNNSNFFLTINFFNLSNYKRGYGYDYNFNTSFNNYYHANDEIGIWKYDIKTKSIKKLIDISDIHDDNNCWIEHISISPDNYHYIFMLRYKLKDGGIRDQLFLSNIVNSSLIQITDFARGSHYNWINSDEFIIYGGINNTFNAIRHKKFFQNMFHIKDLLKVYHKLIRHNSHFSKFITNDSYYIYNIKTKKYRKINATFNLEDGHPSTSSFYHNLMITDRYSDIKNNKKPELYIFDLKASKIIQCLSFNSIKELDNSGFRCDLHPRFSKDGKHFSIDIFSKSGRSFQVYQIT